MSAEEQFQRNQKYYMAVEYLTKLMEQGLISKAQLRRANRYFANLFEVEMRLFV